MPKILILICMVLVSCGKSTSITLKPQIQKPNGNSSGDPNNEPTKPKPETDNPTQPPAPPTPIVQESRLRVICSSRTNGGIYSFFDDIRSDEWPLYIEPFIEQEGGKRLQKIFGAKLLSSTIEEGKILARGQSPDGWLRSNFELYMITANWVTGKAVAKKIADDLNFGKAFVTLSDILGLPLLGHGVDPKGFLIPQKDATGYLAYDTRGRLRSLDLSVDPRYAFNPRETSGAIVFDRYDGNLKSIRQQVVVNGEVKLLPIVDTTKYQRGAQAIGQKEFVWLEKRGGDYFLGYKNFLTDNEAAFLVSRATPVVPSLAVYRTSNETKIAIVVEGEEEIRLNFYKLETGGRSLTKSLSYLLPREVHLNRPALADRKGETFVKSLKKVKDSLFISAPGIESPVQLFKFKDAEFSRMGVADCDSPDVIEVNE